MKKLAIYMLVALSFTGCLDIRLEDQYSDPDAINTVQRARELLRIFDDAAEELMYLGLTASDLKSRLDGKEAKADEN